MAERAGTSCPAWQRLRAAPSTADIQTGPGGATFSLAPRRGLRKSSPVPDLDDDFFAPRAPSPSTRDTHVHSVTEITRAVRGLIETAFGEVWVQGEVSNLRQQ